jgi:hypothetical protein
LYEQNSEFVRNAEDFHGQLHGLLVNFVILPGSMAHLDQGHTGVMIIHELPLGFLERFQRESTGARTEIMGTFGHGRNLSKAR